MAVSMNAGMRKMALLGSVLLMSAIAAPAQAQTLPDPTRPPMAQGFLQDANAQASPAAPVLQSVFMSSHKKVAIISGQAVNVGEKFGDSRVVKITESEVILRNGPTVQTLKLFPGPEKKMSASHIGSDHNPAAKKGR
ncbi:MAG: MSHA biogenesis protein MshK [Pseudomonadota bacterium]